MKKWECTICGYIHEGDEPPESCPLCGAGPEYFKEVVEEAKQSAPQPSSAKNGAAETDSAALQQESSDAAPSGLTALILKFHLHPIT
ncbi:MAG: rubredoxin-type Fe(Cys)4 protein, partial [Deltaproteobacteria bacterium]|nr:rubredoxin-type Fe(Cys)4 protein [Deltaproteobacteria bacterium]